MSLEQHLKPTPDQALLKAANFCAYQERSHKEVIERLGKWGILGLDAQEILLKLIEQDYVNEERFATAYAGGKFRAKHWGRIKIKQGLKLQEVSEYCINKALSQFNEDEYIQTISTLIETKWNETKEENLYIKRNNVAKYVIGKGFEPDLTWEKLNTMK